MNFKTAPQMLQIKVCGYFALKHRDLLGGLVVQSNCFDKEDL